MTTTATAKLDNDGSIRVHVPLTLRRRGGRKVILAPDGSAGWATPQPRIDSTLVKAIARAHRWQRLLENGAFASLRDLADAEKISPTYISRLLRLTLLSPEIVQQVLDGKRTEIPSPVENLWVQQPRM